MNTHESKLILRTEASGAGEELQPTAEPGGAEWLSGDTSNGGSRPDAHVGEGQGGV